MRGRGGSAAGESCVQPPALQSGADAAVKAENQCKIILNLTRMPAGA